MVVFALNLKDCIFLNVISILTSHVRLPSTRLIPEIALKRSFSNDMSRHSVRDVCTTAKYTPYVRPFSSPSNLAYRMSLLPSFLKEPTQDRSGVGPFFGLTNFPGSNFSQQWWLTLEQI